MSPIILAHVVTGLAGIASGLIAVGVTSAQLVAMFVTVFLTIAAYARYVRNLNAISCRRFVRQLTSPTDRR